MKKVLFSIPIVCIILTIFLYTACEKNSTDPGTQENDNSNLVGQWNPSLAVGEVKLTTNSDQQALDFLSQATGSIAITGAHKADLTYLLVLNLGVVQMIQVANQLVIPEFALGKISAYPVFRLELMDIGVAGSAQFVAELGDSEIENFIGNYTEFTYDPGTFSLSVNNSELIKDDFTTSVYANGTLTASSTTIPANVSTTALSLPLLLDDAGSLTLNQDGTFTGVLIFDSESDTLTGTWTVIGANQIQFVATFEGEAGPQTETITATYTVNTGTLTLTLEENPVDYINEFADLTEEEFLDLVELVFGLDPESLESVLVRVTVTFLKSANPHAASLEGRPFTIQSCPENLVRMLIRRGRMLQQKIPNH